MKREPTSDEKVDSAKRLRAQTNEEMEAWFWSLEHLEWVKLEDQELSDRIKDGLASLFLQETGLSEDRLQVVRRHLHVGRGLDESGRFICVTFSFLGNTYFWYQEEEGSSLEEWISQTARTMFYDYRTERDEYGFTELEDWGGWRNKSV